jgi:hypothetical protein
VQTTLFNEDLYFKCKSVINRLSHHCVAQRPPPPGSLTTEVASLNGLKRGNSTLYFVVVMFDSGSLKIHILKQSLLTISIFLDIPESNLQHQNRNNIFVIQSTFCMDFKILLTDQTER